jgi:TonB family protein
MATRAALLIGNTTYQDGKLAKLKAPASDVRALKSVLEDPARGGFAVELLIDQPEQDIRRAVARFFTSARDRDDLTLFYFSGHGVIDDKRSLYLALKETDTTDTSSLLSSALPADLLRRQMDSCGSSRQIVVLDCCHSGAFVGSKAQLGESTPTKEALSPESGAGRAILTATDATQYAWEGNNPVGTELRSVFTACLIEGLQTGAADKDGDGWITVYDAYLYIRDRVRAVQTPLLWTFKQDGQLVLAQNASPVARRDLLDQDLVQDLRDERPMRRLAAVLGLETSARSDSPGVRLAALELLQKAASTDDSNRVQGESLRILKSLGVTVVAPPGSSGSTGGWDRSARQTRPGPATKPELVPQSKSPPAQPEPSTSPKRWSPPEPSETVAEPGPRPPRKPSPAPPGPASQPQRSVDSAASDLELQAQQPKVTTVKAVVPTSSGASLIGSPIRVPVENEPEREAVSVRSASVHRPVSVFRRIVLVAGGLLGLLLTILVPRLAGNRPRQDQQKTPAPAREAVKPSSPAPAEEPAKPSSPAPVAEPDKPSSPGPPSAQATSNTVPPPGPKKRAREDKSSEGIYYLNKGKLDSDALKGDTRNVLGGLIGNQTGEAYAAGGLGLVGTGNGTTGDGTIGLGNLGTIGRGAGSGSGYGRGSGSRRQGEPDVIPGQLKVDGSLNKEIVKRIIRRHLNEVKYCYEQEVPKKPDLGGRIMVQFTIAASGQVTASDLENSTLGNERVENCTLQAVRRWEFPKPLGGGTVTVSSPFVLTPAGTGD